MMKIFFKLLLILFFILGTGLEIYSLEIERQLNPAMLQGIPLGGIGTGKIEVLKNGRFSRMTINNNPHKPITNIAGCFGAVYVSSGNIQSTKLLYQDAANPKAIESATVEGFYPQAQLIFEDTDIPVDIQLRVWNPQIPGNIDLACFPAIVFEYHVTNQSNQSATVSLAQTWQNLIGIGGTLDFDYALSGECIHEPLRQGNLHGLRMGLNTSIMMDQERNTLGNYGLFYEKENNETISYLSSWNPKTEFDQIWQSFAQNGRWENRAKSTKVTTNGTDRPAVGIAATREIPANSESVFRFHFIWYTPHRVDQTGMDQGNYYAKQFDSMAEVADEINKRYEEIDQQWDTFSQNYFQSSLSPEFVEQLFNGLSILSTNGVFIKDESFSLLTNDVSLAGKLGTPVERLAQMDMLFTLYPTLAKSELQNYASLLLPTGETPTTIGNIYSTLLHNNNQEGYLDRVESSMALLLYLYEAVYQTGDNTIIDEHYPTLRKMILGLMDKDITQDFIPDGASFLPWGEERIITLFSGDLWLTSLRAAEELAYQRNDLEFQTNCQNQQRKASAYLQDQLWNGLYFNPFFNPLRPLDLNSGNPYFSILPGMTLGMQKGWTSSIEGNYIQAHYRFLADRFYEQNIIHYPDDMLQQFVAAHTGVSLIRMGYPHTGLQWMRKTKPNNRHLPSAWSYLKAMSGISYDTTFQCFTVGPCPPKSNNKFTLPFKTPHYSGTLRYSQSDMNNVQICELTFEDVPRETEWGIRQFAFLPAYAKEHETHQISVLHNGTILAGQDFAREQLHVFGLTEMLRIQEGDKITLMLAPTTGAKLTIDARQRNIYNHGVKCSIDNISPNTAGFSFQIKNLLNQPQKIGLELFNQGNQQFLVYLDGKNLTSAVVDAARIPVLLQPGAFSMRDLERLRQIQWACGKAVVVLAASGGNTQLKQRLWNLQDQVKNTLAMDAAMRGARIDVIPANRAESTPEIEPAPPSQEAKQAVKETFFQAEKFYQTLNEVTLDPTLASNIAGYFVPLIFDIDPSSIGRETKKFELTLRIRNPFQIPFLINRITLDLPQGWTFESQDDLRIDDRQSPSSMHELRFFIETENNLWKQRFPLSMMVSGIWNEHPFRRNVNFAAGHNFVEQWLIIGPFPNQQGEAFNEEYTPEVNIEPEATYEGIDKQVGWKEYSFPNGYVNFDKIFEPDDHAMAYAYTGIYSSRKRSVQFKFGANGDIKMFMNYKPIFAQRNLNSPDPSSNTLKVDLIQGWNHVVVKCGESTGPWGFYFEVADEDGHPLPDLRYAIDRAD